MSSNKSVVVHLRLPARLVVGCIDYYQLNISDECDSLNSCIADVIDILLQDAASEDNDLKLLPRYAAEKVMLTKITELTKANQQQQDSEEEDYEEGLETEGEVPYRDDATDSERYTEDSATNSGDNTSSGDANSMSEDEIAATMERENKAREAIRNIIDSTLDEISQPHPELDASIFTPDVSELPEPIRESIDINKLPKIDITKILDEDDPLVKEARENEDKLMLEVLASVYYSLPDNLWGSDQARTLASKMKKRIIVANATQNI